MRRGLRETFVGTKGVRRELRETFVGRRVSEGRPHRTFVGTKGLRRGLYGEGGGGEGGEEGGRGKGDLSTETWVLDFSKFSFLKI